MVDSALDLDGDFEAVLGEAVWNACVHGKRIEIQQWILSRVHFYAVSSQTTPTATAEDDRTHADFLELAEKNRARQNTLSADQLIYSFLNHIRMHFKSGFKEPTAPEVAPPTAPSTTAVPKRDKGPKKRVSLTSLQSPVAPTPSWTTQDFPPLGMHLQSLRSTHREHLAGGSGPTKPQVNTLVVKKQTKDKRRIRSTLLTNPVVETSFVSSTSEERLQVPPLEKNLLEKFETRLVAPPAAADPKPPPPPPSVSLPVDDTPSSPPIDTPLSVFSPPEDNQPLDEIDGTPTQVALLYTFLLETKLAPTTNVELQWLFSLLLKDDPDARQFAYSVLHLVPAWLEAYGVDVLKLVVDVFQKCHIATPLYDRFTRYMERTEESRATESQLAGTPLPVESTSASARNFAVPFREDTDSRLHYRTPHETVLYSNREKSRDAFLALLRTWQSAQSAMAGRPATVQPAAVLDDLLVENTWWFAQLFVTELLQVGINPLGEHDRDLVQKIMHDDKLRNPDRLRKLHQRFAQAKAPVALMLEKPKQPDVADDTAASFPDNQLFFYEFLTASNRYHFSSVVAIVLQAQLRQTLDGLATLSPASLRKQFSVTVLQAKLLGKFLGWLHYAPSWTVPKGSTNNAAMATATREAIHMRNHVQVPLDVAAYLEQSVAQHALMAHVPWICDYMTMVAKDPISCGTTYFQDVFSQLLQIYCSPRLNHAPTENTWFLTLQLEALVKSKRVMPPAPRPGDAAASAVLLEEPCREMDAMPFLANGLFVQSCVKDVATFRRFLRTLHHDDKHTTSRKVKLRPYVVHEPSLLLAEDALDTNAPESPVATTESALTVAFYKQYPSLKPTVDFVVETTMTNVCHFANTTLLQPAAAAFVERLHAQVDGTWSKDEQTQWMTAQVRQHLPAAKAMACRQARQAAQPFCKHHIPQAMQSLLSPTIPSRVAAIAIDLATEKAVASLDTLVQTSLAMEFAKHIVTRMRKLKKDAGASPAATVPTSLTQLYALSKRVVETNDADDLERFVDVVRAIPLTPVGWVCLADTLPHVRLTLASLPALRTCVQYAVSHGSVDYADALVVHVVGAALARGDDAASVVELIQWLCTAFPPFGGVLRDLVGTHDDVRHPLTTALPLLFAGL
ncbi:Aste57867_10304 [Aphanomyces stellatus]|uniref:Aste57867_10304 protein n=1 Tax=Aphanomyces stellatus TaxID=120398 RepID=A0A485KQN9_9STRA|nr:hypothetical protein As57867_010264 [Aphanomyces stellatus]VFT87178.1 Aste57867_10304 [Aphanomyces stellatus]